ncbi:hypothetical protein RJ640_020951 [Escallonia rubra]|uniref:DUF4408 domain-containing protein n=1 Tax=Escallonia rubra TaxID=112253 RepID=A0AA88S1H6_9ASTE|nr:hypothetical protein RJ640_020951 [Escallonia rubra]
MDGRLGFDSVKTEKANAIARYRRLRNAAKLLRVVEAFVALTLLSWSSTRLPGVLRQSGAYLSGLSCCLLSPRVVFLIGNAIVIAVFVISRQIDADNRLRTADSYGEYVQISDDQHELAAAENSPPAVAPFSPPPAAEEIAGEKKQIVSSGGNGCGKQIVACLENAVAETEAAAAIEEATRQIRRFERSQSEKLKREISVKRELRRSQTVTRERQIVIASDDVRTMASFDTVDSLSNEEFRLTVEAFIQKQQRSLWAQKMADLDIH